MNTIAVGDTITFERFHPADLVKGRREDITVGKEYQVTETTGVVEVGDTFAERCMGIDTSMMENLDGEQVLTVLDDAGDEYEITTWHTREA